MESETAQGDFMAATGRSRDEAKAFAKDMNSLVGTADATGRSFQDIYKAGIQVAQQFGKTGAEGRELTSSFLAFSRVTRQDAAGAVDDFDAALDAWGEPAERAKGLMDQLIASNQKYGTDAGPAAVKALKDMAPALLSMNMNLDDGVGLLNLFEAAGLDASKAPMALQRAVNELKPGENLNDLIKRISAIEDPTLRAQAAMEIFGTRSGVGLANAIKPGMEGLGDYRLSVEETANTTKRASDDMLTTAEKIKNTLDGILAKARDFGTDLGPMLSGVGALVSLAPALTDLWKKVGGDKVLQAVIKLVGGAAGGLYATGLKLGEKLTDWIKKAWERVLSEPLGKAIQQAAGAAAGAAYAVGIKAFEILRGILNTAWIAIGGDKVMQAAAMAAGGQHGKYYVGGALLAIPIALAELGNMSWDALADFLGGFSREEIWEAAGGRGGAALADGVQQGVNQHGPIDTGQMFGPSLIPQWQDFGERLGGATAESVRAGWVSNGAGIREAEQYVHNLEERILGPARAIGERVPGELGQGMQNKANVALDAAETLRDILKNGLSPRERALELIGADYIKLVRRGMNSEKDGAKETAQEVAIASIATIEQAGLTGRKGQRGLEAIGKYYDLLLASGLTAAQARVALAAGGVSDATIALLEGKKDEYKTAGGNLASAWAAGWLAHIRNSKKSFDAALANATLSYRGYSPPKEGPLRFIDKEAANVGEAWAGGILSVIEGVPARARAPLDRLRSILGGGYGVGSFSLPSMLTGRDSLSVSREVASTTTQRVEHSGRVELDLTPETIRGLRDAGYDERQIADLVGEVGRRLFGQMPMPLAPGQGF